MKNDTQQKSLTSRAHWLACLLFAGFLLSACQEATASAPTLTAPSPAPSTSALTTELTNTPLPILPAATEGSQPALTATSSANTVIATATIDGVAIPAGKIVMPILLYHHVSNEGPAQYRVTPEILSTEMEILKNEGYQTVTVSQVADVIRSGGNLPEKPVAITFDDGYQDIYENAFPILRELGFTATVYIITSTLGTDKSYGYMQEDALKELIAAGWEIGSHSVTHTSLLKTKLGAGNELKQSKEDLEKKLGIKVRSFSYPFGVANQEIKDMAAEMGYDSAVGIDVINTHTTDQLFFLTRREIRSTSPISSFAKALVPSKEDNLLATQSAVLTLTPAVTETLSP